MKMKGSRKFSTEVESVVSTKHCRSDYWRLVDALVPETIGIVVITRMHLGFYQGWTNLEDQDNQCSSYTYFIDRAYPWSSGFVSKPVDKSSKWSGAFLSNLDYWHNGCRKSPRQGGLEWSSPSGEPWFARVRKEHKQLALVRYLAFLH